MSLACSKCLTQISVDPARGSLPPWCPKCGADSKAFAHQPDSALDVLRQARPAGATREAGDTGLAAPHSQGCERNESPPAAALADISPEDLAALAGPPRRPPNCGILLLLALACFAASGYWVSLSVHKLTTNVPVQGTVTDLVVTSVSLKRGPSIHPAVAYQVNGTRYEFQSFYSMSFTRYQRGDAVEVLYSPDNPGAGTINDFDSLWAGPMLPGLPGLALLVLWLLVRFGVRRPGNAHPRACASLP
jgi:hypothetical protein